MSWRDKEQVPVTLKDYCVFLCLILNKPGKILKKAGIFANNSNPDYLCRKKNNGNKTRFQNNNASD